MSMPSRGAKMDLAVNEPHDIGCFFTPVQRPPPNIHRKCTKEMIEFVCKYADKNP